MPTETIALNQKVQKDSDNLKLFDIRVDAICKSAAYLLKHSPKANEVTERLHQQIMEIITTYIKSGVAPQDNTPDPKDRESKFTGA